MWFWLIKVNVDPFLLEQNARFLFAFHIHLQLQQLFSGILMKNYPHKNDIRVASWKIHNISAQKKRNNYYKWSAFVFISLFGENLRNLAEFSTWRWLPNAVRKIRDFPTSFQSFNSLTNNQTGSLLFRQYFNFFGKHIVTNKNWKSDLIGFLYWKKKDKKNQ